MTHFKITMPNGKIYSSQTEEKGTAMTLIQTVRGMGIHKIGDKYHVYYAGNLCHIANTLRDAINFCNSPEE